MSLQVPDKVHKLQRALQAKAKAEPDFRFYALYDKVYRQDVLAHAYQLTRAKRGAAGVDGQDFDAIEAYGVERWLGELAQALKGKTYRPEPVRRVWIDKANGKKRPLGIPTIADRVVQTAAVIVLTPIFEADLAPEQYAYRPGRTAHDAVRHVHRLLSRGYTDVVDADLSGYFDSIPHAELMRSVARRVSDRHLLWLIKRWLVVGVEENDNRGRRRRTNPAKKTKRGIPQGTPISPLLANLYMRRFVVGWQRLGYAQRYQAHIVNFADDFVICCRSHSAEAEAAMARMMQQLKLTVNRDKTHRCRLPEATFDFVGYTFGRCYSSKTGRAYIGTRPSKKSIRRVCREISALTARRSVLAEPQDRVERLNRLMRGWANYFCLGPVSKAYKAVDAHANFRLREWLRNKHKVKGRGTAQYPDEHLYQTLGLTRLAPRTRDLPWAKV
jgi:group II intron reverse transcriptase/maturase